MSTFRKSSLALAGASLLLLIAAVVSGNSTIGQPAAVVCAVGLALGVAAFPVLAGFQFTAWILAAVTAAMIYPDRFLQIGPIDLRNKWIILLIVQAVMFGMGTQMSLRDFAGVVKMPWAVGVGICCQFTIMPLVGFTLTKLLQFPDEIAAGIVLIGSCSSGLASNVMVYLARGNLALSITLTSVATLLAPVMTPLWMKLLAGTLVEVSFLNLMLQIIKIVIVPIGAALLHDYLKSASTRGTVIVQGLATFGMLWLAALPFGLWSQLTTRLPPTALAGAGIFGFLLAAIVAGVIFHWLTWCLPGISRAMPVLSMFGIVYFTAVTTAAGRNDLLQVGGLLVLAAILHNTVGYLLGYWLSRALGMDRVAARTVAFEVGLQNGGMASGLAGAMGKLGTVGLAAAVFSPWMNVSGSILANYWRRKAADEQNVKDSHAQGGD